MQAKDAASKAFFNFDSVNTEAYDKMRLLSNNSVEKLNKVVLDFLRLQRDFFNRA